MIIKFLKIFCSFFFFQKNMIFFENFLIDYVDTGSIADPKFEHGFRK